MAASFGVKLFQPIRMWLGINLLMLGLFTAAAVGLWRLASTETQKLTDVQWDTLVRARLSDLQSGLFRDFVEGAGAEYTGLYFDIETDGQHFTVGQPPESRRCAAHKLEKGGFRTPLTFTLCRPFEFPAYSIATVIGIYLLGTAISLVLILRTERSAVSMLVDFVERHGIKVDRSSGLVAVLGRIQDIAAELDAARRRETDSAKAEAVAHIARQVAHDIRSPLAALDTMAQRLGALPEDQRTVIRGAVTRIHDIAHNLLETKGARPGTDSERAGLRGQDGPPVATSQLALSLVDSLLAEKRIEFEGHGSLQIETVGHDAAYGLFVKVERAGFKRALSNLLNNAAEAMDFRGRVTVAVFASGRDVVVRVSDQGKGISPEHLQQLARPGSSYGKPGGLHQGLGLYQARQMAERAGGALRITSTAGRGTSVDLVLPKIRSPKWFLPSLSLRPGDMVAVLDDDQSAHDVWRLRLGALAGGPRLLHFSEPEGFRAWYEVQAVKSNVVILTDFELIDSSLNGLDICRFVAGSSRAILVTSHDEEERIQGGCVELGVALLPKSQASLVPIALEGERLPAPQAAPTPPPMTLAPA